MARLDWYAAPKDYHMGVDKGVMYLQESDGTYPHGSVWNGLKAVTETPTGGEISKIYADNIQYGGLRTQEGFGGRIETYDYPDDLISCIGKRVPVEGLTVNLQSRRSFGMVYRTLVNANDYILHLIYGINLNPGEHTHKTFEDDIETVVHGLEFITVPQMEQNLNPISLVTIDSRKTERNALGYLEDALFGTNTTDARLPLYDEVIAFEIRIKLVRAVETVGLWKWDTLCFENDSVPAAIHREAELRVFYRPNSSVIQNRPKISYFLYNDGPNSPHPDKNHYYVSVTGKPDEDATIFSYVDAIPNSTLTETKTLTDGYVEKTYSIYYRTASNANTNLSLSVKTNVTDAMMDEESVLLGMVPSLCQENISLSSSRFSGTLHSRQYHRGDPTHYLILKALIAAENRSWYSERDFVAWIEWWIKSEPVTSDSGFNLFTTTGITKIPSTSAKLIISIMKHYCLDDSPDKSKQVVTKKEYSLTGLTLE